MHLIRGLCAHVCVQPRGGGSRQRYNEVVWTGAAEMAYSALPEGERATVSITQAGRVSYWDVRADRRWLRSATNITPKIVALRQGRQGT